MTPDIEQAPRVLVDACRVEGVRAEPSGYLFEFPDSSENISCLSGMPSTSRSGGASRGAVAIAQQRVLHAAGVTILVQQRTFCFGPANSALRTEQADEDEPS